MAQTINTVSRKKTAKHNKSWWNAWDPLLSQSYSHSKITTHCQNCENSTQQVILYSAWNGNEYWHWFVLYLENHCYLSNNARSGMLVYYSSVMPFSHVPSVMYLGQHTTAMIICYYKNCVWNTSYSNSYEALYCLNSFKKLIMCVRVRPTSPMAVCVVVAPPEANISDISS